MPAAEMNAAVRFLEFLLDQYDDEEISEEEAAACASSIEWLKHNEGIPFETVVAECGFTMEQILNHKES